MKTNIGIILIILASFTFVNAQTKTNKQSIPTKQAKTSFEKQFSNATEVKWEKEGSNFEVNFKLGEKEVSAVFEPDGLLQETETTIQLNALPVAAQTYIKQYYAGKKIKESARIEKADGKVIFEAEINKKDVLFDADGKFIMEAKD